MNEYVQTSSTKNSDHAGHVQNDGGDDEDEEGEGEREEDPVGHCVVSVGLADRHRSPSSGARRHKRPDAPGLATTLHAWGCQRAMTDYDGTRGLFRGDCSPGFFRPVGGNNVRPSS
jgi:hypothetical protein